MVWGVSGRTTEFWVDRRYVETVLTPNFCDLRASVNVEVYFVKICVILGEKLEIDKSIPNAKHRAKCIAQQLA